MTNANIIVTCGPSYEPIDEVRRITNSSTGRLGVTLANHLTSHGYRVTCLRSTLVTHNEVLYAARLIPFATNDDLAAKLQNLAREDPCDAVFHAAALCDYRVECVRTTEGIPLASPKIATREGELELTLTPATKVLPKLRHWFPTARIVGWKYELAGSASSAFEKAWRQIRDARTDACVLNGAAYGEGYAFCPRSGPVREWADLEALCRGLEAWLRESAPPLASWTTEGQPGFTAQPEAPCLQAPVLNQ